MSHSGIIESGPDCYIEQPLVVRETRGDWALVEGDRTAHCRYCGNKCATQQSFSFWLYNGIQARKDDSVMVGINPKNIRSTALWTYLVPVMALGIGISGNLIFGMSELYSVACTVIVLLVIYNIRLFSSKDVGKEYNLPEILDRMPEPAEPESSASGPVLILKRPV